MLKKESLEISSYKFTYCPTDILAESGVGMWKGCGG